MKSRDERRAIWRQLLAVLASPGDGPGPLEALHPDAVAAAVRVALTDGLVDDTDWLAEPAAGAAFYELASALPPSTNEQRELGRRVAARLLQGSAETFSKRILGPKRLVTLSRTIMANWGRAVYSMSCMIAKCRIAARTSVESSISLA